MEKHELEAFLNATLEIAAMVAEHKGQQMGHPDVGAEIAKAIRDGKAPIKPRGET